MHEDVKWASIHKSPRKDKDLKTEEILNFADAFHKFYTESSNGKFYLCDRQAVRVHEN